MTARIAKDTVLCMSLAGNLSNIGTRFHNYLYEEMPRNSHPPDARDLGSAPGWSTPPPGNVAA